MTLFFLPIFRQKQDQMKFFRILPLLLLGIGCNTHSTPEKPVSFYETELFKDVQLQGIFEDSKTFVDLVPKTSLDSILVRYNKEKTANNFDLHAFVATHFSDAKLASLSFATDTTKTMYEHIHSIWPKLTRGPDKANRFSSRIALPKSYVVPGGRFQEIYYWDSYFTLEGLVRDGQEELAAHMVANFGFLIDSLGFIPNGTRNYYLTRSQPPYYSLMVAVLARKDSMQLLNHLPQLEKEYSFWMSRDTMDKAGPYTASRHTIELPSNKIINRYWDSGTSPRPESYKEDYELADSLPTTEAKQNLYANLRAGAASGWDYSTRWYAKEGEFGSTATAEIAAIDLNCLLYYMESQLAKAYGMKGVLSKQNTFNAAANQRKEVIQALFWDTSAGYFMDYNFKEQHTTDELTLAGAFPLFFKLATEEQASAVKEKLMNPFLKDGGLVTTLKHSGQQWDAPNGWAPLQWIAVHGLLNYGYTAEAREIMQRWLSINERVYENTGKMMEKYNVEDTTLLSGGGEYPTQDGFGWTNGVAIGFKQLLERLENERNVK